MKSIDGLPVSEAILRAAISTFIEQGYEKASMDQVAALARTTKRTVYAYFDNKEVLFRASVNKAVELFQSELPRLDPAGEPAAELQAYAGALSDLWTWRGAVRLQRVVMSEAESFSDLGQLLYDQVIAMSETRVAEYLLARSIGANATSNLARLFVNMATGPQRFATLLQAREPVPEHPALSGAGPDREWIAEAVRFFLQGIESRKEKTGT